MSRFSSASQPSASVILPVPKSAVSFSSTSPVVFLIFLLFTLRHTRGRSRRVHFELVSMSHFSRKTRKALKKKRQMEHITRGIFLQWVSHQICDLYFYFFFHFYHKMDTKEITVRRGRLSNPFICSPERGKTKVKFRFQPDFSIIF